MHAPSFKLITDTLGYNSYEYLAFGEISGSAHKTVSWEALKAHGIKNVSETHMTEKFFTIEQHGRSNDVEMDLTIARDVGVLYGPDYELAVAANLVAGSRRNADEDAKVMEALSRYPVPEEWRGDQGVLWELGGVEEAGRVVSLLRSIAEQAYGASGHPFDVPDSQVKVEPTATQ
ncbi:hypothetical protein LTR85_005192 [Meristemomyces frigidus]|nr:hypothetical protein LTR85_005192 [Meristemomyces frigidus]